MVAQRKAWGHLTAVAVPLCPCYTGAKNAACYSAQLGRVTEDCFCLNDFFTFIIGACLNDAVMKQLKLQSVMLFWEVMYLFATAVTFLLL